MSVDHLPPPVWVDTATALHRLVDDLMRQRRVAVDTESNSLYAYRERVCLLQFSTPETDYLLDPLTLTDLRSLAPFFASPEIEKVFHASEYDVICLKRDFGFTFANLFDTMLAARILGYEAVGLGSLLAEKFGVHLNKRYQRANWGKRPLEPELLRYARLDTHYLLPLRDRLQAELEAAGLWPLAREDFAMACEVTPNHHPGRKGCSTWERLDSHRTLSPRQRTILDELCHCRERLAKRADRPVFKIVSDRTLVHLAQAVPQDKADLAEAGLSSRQIRRFGSELLSAVRKGMRAPLVRRSVHERPDPAFVARLEALKEWRKREARRMGVGSDVVLPRRLLYAIASRAPADERELAEVLARSPWRLEHFGAQILEVLRGN
ncbi:MAG: hypothetical protein D6770_02875 [Anaerolineae bacterium]|nr:MAG: hypothetical protein D6770_02875 [Anaerolineae bacterium]